MLLVLKIILFCAIATGTVVKLFFQLNERASALQQVYVRAAKGQGGDSSRWDGQRMFIVSKIGVIFIGVTIIAMSFAILLKPVVIGA